MEVAIFAQKEKSFQFFSVCELSSCSEFIFTERKMRKTSGHINNLEQTRRKGEHRFNVLQHGSFAKHLLNRYLDSALSIEVYLLKTGRSLAYKLLN